MLIEILFRNLLTHYSATSMYFKANYIHLDFSRPLKPYPNWEAKPNGHLKSHLEKCCAIPKENSSNIQSKRTNGCNLIRSSRNRGSFLEEMPIPKQALLAVNLFLRHLDLLIPVIRSDAKSKWPFWRISWVFELPFIKIFGRAKPSHPHQPAFIFVVFFNHFHYNI